MRKIDLDPPATKTWRRWLDDCDKATRKVIEQVAKGGKPSFSTLYKRKSIKSSFFFRKGPPFYGKCAYCEAPITDYQHGDVEHFRPKGGVTDEDDQPVSHPGYYWLAYDWRNLLPACAKCNQPGVISGRKVGKHNRFPVEGSHALKPGEEAQEKPLLIHPASGQPEDDPQLHLTVDTRTGIMGHRTERGRKCIDIFALNLRDQLVTDRKRASREVWQLLNDLLKPGGNPEAAQELAEIRKGQRSFTMVQLAVLQEAEALLSPVIASGGKGKPE